MNSTHESPESDPQAMAVPIDTANSAQGHRSKRIKTENPTSSSKSNVKQTSISTGAQNAESTPLAPVSNGDEANGHTHTLSEIEALANEAAASAMAGLNEQNNSGGGEHLDHSAVAAYDTSNSHLDLDEQRPQSSAPEIDLSSAPSDPTELAIWVAKQISHFGEGRYSVGSDDEDGRPRMLMHPPALFNRRFDDDDDPVKVAERERVREENRERKKRWRQSNMERNKDNDLRCRINKRAKKLYGLGQSQEKSAWMESEFNKRRTKRETKERIRSFDPADFTGFQLTPGFQNALFPAPGIGPQGDTNAAGLLLANALLGVGNSAAGPNAEAANALKAALEEGMVDPKPFTEALKTMAMNPEIMSGISAVLGYANYDDDVDMNSGDETADMPLQTTEQTQNDSSVRARSTDIEDHSSDVIKALNAATAMLNEMNGSAPEAATQAREEGAPNGFTAINGSSTQKDSGRDESPNTNGHGLDQSQIDALLALANGGSLTGDGEHATHLVTDEPTSPHPERTYQPDNDITATLQHIIQQLMGNSNSLEDTQMTNGGQSANGRGSTPSASAEAFHNLLNSTGVSINTVIPAAQGHATSQLYARLSNHSRGSTPSGGGINPAHASAYGSTQQMNEKILARSKSKGRSSNLPSFLPRVNALAPPTRQISKEEADKIRIYGFPPKPRPRAAIVKKGKKVEKAERAEKTEKSEMAEKSVKTGKTEKIGKSEKSSKAEK